MDLEGMYVNRPQYINVLLTSSVNMYFRITDFTPDELKNNTISYILDISLATQKRCPSCVQGHQSPSQTTCQCLPCASNYQGNDCGILVTPLVFGTVVEKKVTGPTYLFFSSSAQVDTVFTVQKNSSSNAYCMVKYKNFSDELAAYPNV